MSQEHERNSYRAKAIQRGNAAAAFRLIPNRQPSNPLYRSNPPPPSRTTRRGINPARFSARCLRLTTSSPGAVVAADTSLPLLLI
jgi:hypothetical protein